MLNYLGIVKKSLFNEIEGLANLLSEPCSHELSLRQCLSEAVTTATQKSNEFEMVAPISGRELKKMNAAANLSFVTLNSKKVDDWDESVLHKINWELLQGQHSYGYRNVRVSLSGSMISLPSPEKVPYHMNMFFRILKDDVNNLEKSILAHFSGVRIHPYIDGNGRTFRLIQNSLLYKAHIFPFVIKQEMRNDYFNLLENASKEWRDIYDSNDMKNEALMYQKLYKMPRKELNSFGNYVAETILNKAFSCI